MSKSKSMHKYSESKNIQTIKRKTIAWCFDKQGYLFLDHTARCFLKVEICEIAQIQEKFTGIFETELWKLFVFSRLDS